MNKLFIALPILALLTLGAFYHVSQQNVEASSALTIDQWQFCFQRLNNFYCDQLTDSTQLSACYAAANATSGLVWDGAKNEIPACVSWYTYFQQASAGSPLNANNYYQSCFTNQNAVAAAEKSTFYFSNIYAPKYLTCAGFSA